MLPHVGAEKPDHPVMPLDSSQIAGGLPVMVLLVCRRTAEKEIFAELKIPPFGGDMQGCVSPAVRTIECGPLVEKQPAGGIASRSCDQVQSGLSLIVDRFGIGPGEEEETKQLQPIHQRDVVEGCIAIAILHLHIRALGEKHFATHLISRSNRPDQRASLLFDIPGFDADRICLQPPEEALHRTESRFGEQITLGPLPEKIFMDLRVGAPGGVANGIPAGSIPDFEQAWIPGEKFANHIKISPLHSLKEVLGFHFFRN